MAKAKPKRIRCVGYELRGKNGDDAFRLELIARGEDGKTHNFGVDQIQDRPGLVVEMFEALRTVWPSYSFYLTVTGGEITGFSAR